MTFEKTRQNVPEPPFVFVITTLYIGYMNLYFLLSFWEAICVFHLNFVEVSVQGFGQKFRYTAHLTPVQTCTGIKLIIIQRNVKYGLIHRKNLPIMYRNKYHRR